MKQPLYDRLNSAIADLIPGAFLHPCRLPGASGLRGLFLEQEWALRPLPPENVEAVMSAPPFWALLWPSGERLCRLFSEQGSLVEGRTVLDFGCGCGLVAAAASKAGAAKVWAVDCDPLALAAASWSALENQVSVDVCSNVQGALPVDLLVLADFLYDQVHMPLFESLQANASEVLVVDSRLSQLPNADFQELGEDQGRAVPDLDPHREFGRLRFWYRGSRRDEWARALGLSHPVAPGLHEC